MSAGEMLCFTRCLGIMIGDLIPISSEIWQLHVILKQIINILTSKIINKDYPSLLRALINGHHELYLKLFNTNLKPKHQQGVHYPLIMEKIGPLVHVWSMRFESKHRSQTTVHYM